MGSYDVTEGLHFGEVVNPGKYGARLTRELYAIPNKKAYNRPRRELFSDAMWEREAWAFEDEDHKTYTDEYCELQRAAALENFDLNMAFFKTLPAEPLDEALNALLSKRKRMRQVHDLRTLDGKEGVYILVLDDYRQAYVGTSIDMRKRIKSHWTGTKPFDRLLFGHKHESVIAVDAFRILDTTRIYAIPTSATWTVEEKVVEAFPPDYLLNRIHGGEMFGMRAMFISAEMKRRGLVPDEGAAATETAPQT